METEEKWRDRDLEPLVESGKLSKEGSASTNALSQKDEERKRIGDIYSLFSLQSRSHGTL